MPSKKSRKYCCICSNYRGKNVDGKVVSLHRYPANGAIRRIWLQRSRLVRKDFVYTTNSQICSQHFVNSKGPSTDHPLPSVFPNKVFKTSSIQVDDYQDEIETREVEDRNVTEQPSFLLSPTISVLNNSLMFHDYCGPVDAESFSPFTHKSVQTVHEIRTKEIGIQCDLVNRPIYTNNSTQTIQNKMVDCETQANTPMLTYEDVKNDKQKLLFYTGIPDSMTFDCLFDEMKDDAAGQTARHGASSEQGRPRHLRLIDEFFLVLMRLRLGLLLEDLADRFCISTSTCGTIFNKWIDYLDVQLSFLIMWPSRKAVNDHMPPSFCEKYPTCRVIVDCTEIRTETPSSLQSKSLMFSDYKSHMTWKGLVGISPAGAVTFVSDLWAGSVSDKVITQKSHLLDLCESGDSIMADKGFLISDLTTPRGIHLIIPPFKNRKRQLSKREVSETRTIANLRIHVERQMERIKNFNILKTVMPLTMSHQVSKIWKLCARLTNLQPPLCNS